MANVLIIGYGNPLRGDDGLGPEISKRLALFYAGDSRIKVLSSHQLNPELADDIASAEYVIFIDASEHLAPGLIARESLTAETSYRNSTHLGKPASLLTLCLDLCWKCPPASLITIGGASFDFGETLSPSAERTIPQVMSLVSEVVDKNLRAQPATQLKHQ